MDSSEKLVWNLTSKHFWKIIGFAVDCCVGVISAGIQWFWIHGQLTPTLFLIPRLFCT